MACVLCIYIQCRYIYVENVSLFEDNISAAWSTGIRIEKGVFITIISIRSRNAIHYRVSRKASLWCVLNFKYIFFPFFCISIPLFCRSSILTISNGCIIQTMKTKKGFLAKSETNFVFAFSPKAYLVVKLNIRPHELRKLIALIKWFEVY